jgi:hypothetical protein
VPFVGLPSFQAVIRRSVALRRSTLKEQKLAECSAAACTPRECEVVMLNNLNEEIGGVLPRQDQTSRYDELR